MFYSFVFIRCWSSVKNVLVVTCCMYINDNYRSDSRYISLYDEISHFSCLCLKTIFYVAELSFHMKNCTHFMVLPCSWKSQPTRRTQVNQERLQKMDRTEKQPRKKFQKTSPTITRRWTERRKMRTKKDPWRLCRLKLSRKMLKTFRKGGMFWKSTDICFLV